MNPLVRTLVTASLPLAVAACSTTGGSPAKPTVPTVPAAIAAPTGSTLAVTLKGSGMQNYECRAKAAGGTYDWAFVGPEAVLRDRTDAIVGKHYGGPTWEHGDGSRVTGQVVADTPAPEAGNIPWLLLKGTPAATPGAFAGVGSIQRINTIGGVAPSDTCSAATVGTRKAVRYTADYVFYRS